MEDSTYYESCSKKYEQLSTDTLFILCNKLKLEVSKNESKLKELQTQEQKKIDQS